MNCKTVVAGIALLLFFGAAGPVAAEEDKTEPNALSLTATYAGRYLWRGLVLNPDPTFQPGAEISHGGITLGAWASLDLTGYGRRAGYGDESGNATEIDYYGTAAFPLGDKVELSTGFLNYTFPHTYFESTTEVFAGIAFDVPASPTLTSYVDADAGQGANYTELSLSHSFELTDSEDWGVALDLEGRIGYANGKYYELYLGRDATPGWSDWCASVALPVTIPGGFTFTPTGVYTSMIGDGNRRAVQDSDLDPDNWAFLASLSWDTEF